MFSKRNLKTESLTVLQLLFSILSQSTLYFSRRKSILLAFVAVTWKHAALTRPISLHDRIKYDRSHRNSKKMDATCRANLQLFEMKKSGHLHLPSPATNLIAFSHFFNNFADSLTYISIRLRPTLDCPSENQRCNLVNARFLPLSGRPSRAEIHPNSDRWQRAKYLTPSSIVSRNNAVSTRIRRCHGRRRFDRRFAATS